MRGFGRQCRGQGRVFLPLVRQTERQLLALGQPIPMLGQQAQQLLAQATDFTAAQREGWTLKLTAALGAPGHIRQQSGRLTHGKKLRHCKIVNAYDPPSAPLRTGQSNCPAQFGRKPGIASEPATGFIFATQVPPGNPSDPSSGLPLLDKVHSAIPRVSAPQRLQVHSVAGDLGVKDTARRQALPARGILTVGIPKTVEPINPQPTTAELRDLLTEAGLTRQRTPAQGQLACACGSSRPVVESPIASLLSRGAGQVRYHGLQGAVVQLGMTVMAHNAATVVRIQHNHLSKRAQKFRRLLRLKRHKANEFKDSKN